MMGRTHALTGAAAWLAAAPPIATTFGAPLDAPTMAAGAVVTAGAALLPDIDNPRSTIARALGPLSQLLAVGVAALAGGHRQATHSLAFAAAAGLTVAAGLATPAGHLVAALVGALCVGLAVRALGPQRTGGRLRETTLVALALGLTWVGLGTVADLAWLPAAIAAGALLHVLGDLLTGDGAPLLWPLQRRFSLPVLGRTGSPAETLLSLGLAACVVWLAATALPAW